MHYQHRVKLLGNKETWAKEITFGQYKTIVKSIYNTDDSSFIYHTNLTLQSNLNDEVYSELTVLDKALILLQLKAVSIEPDFKLKIKCEETKKDFEYTLPIDTLIKSFILTDSLRAIDIEGFTIEFSLVKAKDEQYFVEPYITSKDHEQYFFNTVVSSINSIKYKDQFVLFKDLNWDERVRLVSRLPAKLSSYIINNVSELEKSISINKLVSVRSPYTNKITLEVPLTTNIPSLIRFSKLIFSENLGNLYTLTYNLINKGGFTGDYLDSVTPIEMQVFWIYCQKQMEKESEQNDDSSNMARSNSEFT
jgi:hypothetical protein